jgi:ariadne-1
MSYEEWSDDDTSLIHESDYLTSSTLPNNPSKYIILTPNQITIQREFIIQDIMSKFGFSYYQSITLCLISWWSIQEASRLVIDGHRLDFLCLSPAKTPYISKEKTVCLICLKKKSAKRFYTLECGHIFCRRCLKAFLNDAVSSGMECLRTTCPDFSCNFYIPGDVFEHFLSLENARRYNSYISKSYVNYSDKLKWCPNPNCENVVEILEDVKEVICTCAYFWCINCGNEAHRPLNCERLNEWNVIIKGKEENTELWIIANSKKCPACSISIQKNEGCIHMTCKCGHEFCWLCLGQWKLHNAATGGTSSCTIYKEQMKKPENVNEEIKKQLVAQTIQCLNYYIEQFMHYKKYISLSKEKLKNIIDITKAIQNPNKPYADLSFFLDGAGILLQAYSGLCYSYALAYFLKDLHKLTLNEFLQSQVSDKIQVLEEFVNMESMDRILEIVYDETKLIGVVNGLRKVIMDLALTLKSYLSNSIQQMEQEFPQIQDSVKTPEMERSLKEFIFRKYRIDIPDWSCSACSFINPGSVTVCGMCLTART